MDTETAPLFHEENLMRRSLALFLVCALCVALIVSGCFLWSKKGQPQKAVSRPPTPPLKFYEKCNDEDGEDGLWSGCFPEPTGTERWWEDDDEWAEEE